MTHTDTVVVSIPARAEFLHVLRSVVGSLGALADASIDVIDDLRISVDEACSQLLSSGTGATRLSLEVRSAPDGLEILTSVDGDAELWPPIGGDETLAWQVLRALSDEASFERFPDGVGIRFRKSVKALK